MFAASKGDLLFAGEEIAHCRQIAARVCSTVGDLRRAVKRCSSANDHRADGLILINPAGQVNRGPAIEIESSTRKAEGGAIDDVGGKNMGLTQTSNLFAQENIREADGVACRRMSVAVVDGINNRKGICVRQILIETYSAEILADMLHRVAEGLRDSARRSSRSEKLRAIGHGPKCEQRLDAGHSAGSRFIVRY